jgi:biopolymer transport protein ExbD
MKSTIQIFLLLVLFTSIFSVSANANTDRNVLYVYIDSYNRVFVEHELTDIKDLKDIVKSFIANPTLDHNNSEQVEREIELIGNVMLSKGVISIQCERNTTYGFYIKVQNELEKAFNELRNEFALAHFKAPYKRLNKDKQEAVNDVYPKSISEAEPNLVRNEKGELVRNNRGWGWYCF